MAIYQCSIKIIGRSSGRSSVGASAYRSGEKIKNEQDGMVHDYRKKTGIIYSEVLLPDYAPIPFKNRATLWNEVEKIEKGKNAQLSREVQVALPVELHRVEQIKLIQDYVTSNFLENGMIADVNIHDKGDGNPHAHIMLTVRSMDENGEWQAKQKKEYILDHDGNKQYDPIKKTYKCRTTKMTDWDNKEKLLEWRENWAKEVNQALKEQGIDERIDHRSYKEQGIEKIPQIHMGHEATAMERRGIKTYKGNINRQIEKQNVEIEKLKLQEKQIDDRKDELTNQYKTFVEQIKQTQIEIENEALKRREAPKVQEVAQERKEAPKVQEVAQKRKEAHIDELPNKLNEAEKKYLYVKKHQAELIEDRQKYLSDSTHFSSQAKSLSHEFETIDKIAIKHDKINDTIQELRKGATFFHNNKKEISALEVEKKDLADSFHQKVARFEKEWGIPFRQKSVKQKVKIIRENEQKAKKIVAEINRALEPSEELKQKALLEYQTGVFYVETLTNKEEILAKFEILRKNERSGEKRSVIGRLNEINHGLINDRDRRNVIEYQKTKNPDLAKKLEVHLENAGKKESYQRETDSKDRGFER